MSQQSVVNSQFDLPLADSNVPPSNFVLTNCVGVHIGPKYIHTNNITYNHRVADQQLEDDFQIDDEVVDNSFCPAVYKYTTIFHSSHVKILVFGLFFVLLILVTILIFINPDGKHSDPEYQHNDDYPVKLKFVLRETWGAAPSHAELENNTMPLERVIFIHTVSSGTCNNFAFCKQKIIEIQEWHMEEQFGDIGYNFVIGSDGYIYVGIGWDKVGSHTKGCNRGSLGVAFIGDFRKDEPNEDMLKAAKTLLDFGVTKSKLSENYQLFGHCQVHSNFPYSPGVNILKHITLWPHWNDTNVNKCANFNFTFQPQQKLG